MVPLNSTLTPASDPPPQFLQGKMTYIGLLLAFSASMAGRLGAKYPADQVNDLITCIGANWDTFSTCLGLLMALWGRIRINFRTHLALALLGACMTLLCSCEAPQGVMIKKDGTFGAENGGTFFHKSDKDTHHLEAWGPNNWHVVMDHEIVKPDGTEATKFAAYGATTDALKIAAHSKDIQTRTAAAPGIIKAKSDGAAEVITAKGTQDTNLQNAVNAAGQ